MGNVQKLKILAFAKARARYDMLDYIRRETGSRNRQLATRKADALRNKGNNEHVLQNHDWPNVEIISLEVSAYQEDPNEVSPSGRKDIIPAKPDGRTEQIDTKDLFEKLCKGLCRQDALLLKLCFLEEFNQREAGDVLGHSESRISQLLTNLLPRIRVILKNLGYENEMRQKPEPDRAEYKRLWRQEKLNRKRHALAVCCGL